MFAVLVLLLPGSARAERRPACHHLDYLSRLVRPPATTTAVRLRCYWGAFRCRDCPVRRRRQVILAPHRSELTPTAADTVRVERSPCFLVRGERGVSKGASFHLRGPNREAELDCCTS